MMDTGQSAWRHRGITTVLLCLMYIATTPATVSADPAGIPTAASPASAPTQAMIQGSAVVDAAEALLFDLEKLVYLREQRGWTIDKHMIQGLLTDSLMSVCLADRSVLEKAAELVEIRILREGGPLKRAWLAHGKSLDDLSDLLTLHRVKLLLKTSHARKPTDCPFYMETDPTFSARHRDDSYGVIAAEGGGLFTVRQLRSRYTVGGGGSGRITLGYGFDPRWSIRFGPELGGAALVKPDLRAESVEVDFFGALPVTFRYITPTFNYDFEVAAIGLGVPWRDKLRAGVRAGMMLGITSLRIRSLLPWAGYSVNVEYITGRDEFPSQWSLRMGFRIGFVLRLFRP